MKKLTILEMSDEEHHETFEATGAGASMTYPLVSLAQHSFQARRKEVKGRND